MTTLKQRVDAAREALKHAEASLPREIYRPKHLTQQALAALPEATMTEKQLADILIEKWSVVGNERIAAGHALTGKEIVNLLIKAMKDAGVLLVKE